MSTELKAVTANGQEKPSGLMITHETQQKVSEILKGLSSLNPGINIAPQYLEFEEVGDTKRVVFMGWTTFTAVDEKTGESRELNAVALMDETESTFINAGTQVVNACVDLTPYTPIEIKYAGDKKTKSGGRMKRYEVRPLHNSNA